MKAYKLSGANAQTVRDILSETTPILDTADPSGPQTDDAPHEPVIIIVD